MRCTISISKYSYKIFGQKSFLLLWGSSRFSKRAEQNESQNDKQLDAYFEGATEQGYDERSLCDCETLKFDISRKQVLAKLKLDNLILLVFLRFWVLLPIGN